MPVRFSVQGLMIFVALAGLGMAAFRVHPSLGAFVSGVSCMALIRTTKAVETRRMAGDDVTPTFVVRKFLASWGLAAFIVTAALLPGMCLLAVADPYRDFDFQTALGVFFAALFGLPLAIILRRRYW